MKLRRAEREDLKRIAELEAVCFGVPWSLKLLEETYEQDYNFFWVAEDGDRFCGYAILQILGDEGEVDRIAVDPSARKQGIGQLLMEAMLFYAKKNGVAQMALEVRAGNSPAIHLYERNGFIIEGIRKKYYREPVEDAAIMWNHHISGVE